MKDRTGEKYGRLEVISFDKRIGENRTKYRYYWNCKCECGIVKSISYNTLQSKHALSCGCYRNEQVSKANTVHGAMINSRKFLNEFKSYQAMVYRCTNPKSNRYYMYGAKGITVCSKWLKSFNNFIKDMGIKPSKEYSIDRIDGTKGYYKENCRWATSKEQANNRSNNKNKKLCVNI